MGTLSALQVVAAAARNRGRLCPLSRAHAIFRSPASALSENAPHGRLDLRRRSVDRRALGNLHPVLRRAYARPALLHHGGSFRCWDVDADYGHRLILYLAREHPATSAMDDA